MSFNSFCQLAAVALSASIPVFSVASEVDVAAFDIGWKRVKAVFADERTKNIYALPPRDCEPLTCYSNGLLIARGRYPKGIEDCAIVGGIALSMLVDRFAVTHENGLKHEARWVAEGLRNLTFAHGYPGYVSRGLHPVDGRSIGALSSRDQVTHLVHGLWRYAKSPLASADDRHLACTTVTAVAEWMLRTVKEETDWNFGQADGQPDPRGVCKMRYVQPHEAARLASVYAAAWDLNGQAKYRTALEDVLSEAVVDSERIESLSPHEMRMNVPDYALIQMSSSLEVLAGCDLEVSIRGRIERIRDTVARLAKERDERSEPYCPWLCGEAERPLVRLMASNVRFTDDDRKRLCTAVESVPFTQAESTRIVELSSAYWRMRRIKFEQTACGNGLK